MIDTIFRDEKQILPASTLMDGHYGQTGLYASVPCVLGKNGVEEMIVLNLTEEEQAAFCHTCQVMKDYMVKIQ